MTGPRLGMGMPTNDGWIAREFADLKRQILELRSARTVDYTTITPGSPFEDAMTGMFMPAYVLKLSPTDPAFNDAAIEAAIASFQGRQGLIYAPAGGPIGTPSYGDTFTYEAWPIGAAHDFQNCDLVGAGPFIYDGNTVGSAGPGTVFLCTTEDAQFNFTGIGNVTGGWSIDANLVARQPFARAEGGSWIDGSGTGRVFRNITVGGGIGAPPHPTGTGYVISTAAGSVTRQFTVTNSTGVDTTATLTLHTLTAATFQSALEGLSNVGAGNVVVTANDVTGSPGVGGPFAFDFTGGAVPDSTMTDTVIGGSGIYNLCGGDTNAAVKLSGYYDTYINLSVNNPREHGLLLDGCNDAQFINCYVNDAGGHSLIVKDSSNVTFTQGAFYNPGLANAVNRGNSYAVNFDGQWWLQQLGVQWPMLDLTGASGIWAMSNVYARGPVIAKTDGATLALYGAMDSSGKYVLDGAGAYLDNKASDVVTGDIVPINGAALAQAAGQLPTGLAHDGNLGFYATVPIAQPANPGTAAGTDAAVINALTAALVSLGLIAP